MHDRNVLVVEDDDSIRRLLLECLEGEASRVSGARDGVDALHEISSRRDYAVVILDLMMPNMSGIDFLTSLSALTSDPSFRPLRTPPSVIVITGASPQMVPAGELEKRFAAFVRCVHRKPLDVTELVHCVQDELAEKCGA